MFTENILILKGGQKDRPKVLWWKVYMRTASCPLPVVYRFLPNQVRSIFCTTQSNYREQKPPSSKLVDPNEHKSQ